MIISYVLKTKSTYLGLYEQKEKYHNEFINN